MSRHVEHLGRGRRSGRLWIPLAVVGAVVLSALQWAPLAAAAGAGPVNTELPVVTVANADNPPIVGDTLVASEGTWTGDPTGFTYQWYSGTTKLVDATASSYTLTTNDTSLGGTDAYHTFSVVVTATNGSGSSSATALPTGEVEPYVPGEQSGDILMYEVFGPGFSWNNRALPPRCDPGGSNPAGDPDPFCAQAYASDLFTIDSETYVPSETSEEITLTDTVPNSVGLTFSYYYCGGQSAPFPMTAYFTATSHGYLYGSDFNPATQPANGCTFTNKCLYGVPCTMVFSNHDAGGIYDGDGFIDVSVAPYAAPSYVWPPNTPGGLTFIPLRSANGSPPTASFTTTADPVIPGAVDFDASASTPSSGASIASYTWNFGDGSAAVTTTTPTTAHTYTSPAHQTVTLTVKDSAGRSATASKPLDLPVASFVATPDPTNPLALDFDASGSTASGGASIATYTWNFGDGSPPVSTHSPTTTYAYAAGGLYTVTLTVTDSSGQTSSIQSQQVVVAAYVVNSITDTPSTDPTKPVCDTGSTVVVNATTVPECTLRAAIQSVNAAGHGVITFNLATAGNDVIQPATGLPPVTAPDVTLDGTTGPGGYVGLNGFDLDKTTPDITLSGARDTIQGFQAENSYVAIQVDSVDGGDVVRGNELGISSSSSSPTGVTVGIDIENSPDAVVGGMTATDRNVLSSLSSAVIVHGPGSSGARIEGNYFGTDPTGTIVRGDFEVVGVVDASDVTVGGPAPTPGQAPGNLMVGMTSGSTTGAAGGSSAIFLGGLTSNDSNDAVEGNTIGLLSDGTTGAGSSFLDGITVSGRASGTVIGTSTPGTGNVISGAQRAQIEVDGTSVSGTTIKGNLIGTDTSGEAAVPAGGSAAVGVVIAGARTTTVGSPGAGRNVITNQHGGLATQAFPNLETSPFYGNATYPGTSSSAPGYLSSIISGNIIGPFADGTTGPPVPQSYGVQLVGSGDTLGPNNQISFNGGGVYVTNAGETVVGNDIGTDALGTTALPNGTGVALGAKGISGFTLGVAGEKPNTISGNLLNVVALSPTLIQNNYVGTTSLGNAAIAPYAGIVPEGITEGQLLSADAGLVTVLPGSTVGGTRPGTGNVVSGNAGYGIGALASTVIQGNKIGVGANGVTPVPNGKSGVYLASGAGSSLVGGSPTKGAPKVGPWSPPGPPGGNIIAYNGGEGIDLETGVGLAVLLSNSVFANKGDGIVWAASGIHPPVFTAPPFQDGGGGTDVMVTVTAKTPGTIVQVYLADSCSATGAQGKTLLDTEVINSPGIVLSGIPLQPVGTAITATETVNGGTASTDTTSAFAPCTYVEPKSASVSPSVVTPSASVTATGTGFAPGEPVTATVHSTPVDLGTYAADAHGSVTIHFTVPSDLEPGTHALVLTGLTSGHVDGAVFVVNQAPGYRAVGSDGGVFAYGGSGFFGSEGGVTLDRPVVGTAATPDGGGYWLVASDGGVFAFGDARFHGSLSGSPLAKPIVGMAATPDGGGYWLVASDGGVFAFGDARFHGSLSGTPLAKPIVGMAATPDGGGYWLVASDGGVFAFGDARFHGSAGGTALAQPIVGMAATPDGGGYWLVASDGGVFAFGDARFHGSKGGAPLDRPIVGMAATPSGQGYWLVASDGGVFSYGDAQFYGSTGGAALDAPVVGIAG